MVVLSHSDVTYRIHSFSLVILRVHVVERTRTRFAISTCGACSRSCKTRGREALQHCQKHILTWQLPIEVDKIGAETDGTEHGLAWPEKVLV